MSTNDQSNPGARSSQPRLRCAVYARKSTEEGLDQEFNSLDAQREACSAFIASQVGLGWKLAPDRYDDGGISGGTMERPALQRLLQDIRDRKIDVVVVYKIDRLTRSLADFAKIVEVFDGHSVSFVSVTQQFNTTTSMGRLTLNVLLSFAQFEREVTAERIRDKIAASRKKGMWMGGTVPLGYRVQDRKLVINEPEASFIRGLFSRYLELKSVPKLAMEVSRQAAAATDPQVPESIRDRYRTRPMFPGMLNKLLVNPTYIGKVRHNREVYDGEHEPLIDVELFEAVRKQLALGAPVPKGTAMHRDTHLLTGILFDDTGDRMSPTHGKSNGRRYRYYVSSRVRKSEHAVPDSWRIPAKEIEKVVREQAVRILRDQPLIASWIEDHASADQIHRGMAQADSLALTLSEHEHAARQRAALAIMFPSINLSTSSIRFEVKTREVVAALLDDDVTDQTHSPDDIVSIELPIMLRRRGNGMRIVIDPPYAQPEPDPSLVDLIARAHIYLDRLTGPSAMNTTSIAKAFEVDRADVGRILPLAFLSPKMLDAILTGRQPASLTPRYLARAELPIRWARQDAFLQ
ncbi:MAG TPA: recombinase family protein [Rhizobiaceae bacterium]|nr:recombinase family protein [Rhizobiaceae bacterium]